MADRLGVTTSGYYKNEHGDTLPSVSSLKRKNLQAECKKRDEVLTKLQEKTTFIESRPEMQELLEYIEKVPIFYHKLMVFFQEYKMEHNKPGRSK